MFYYFLRTSYSNFYGTDNVNFTIFHTLCMSTNYLIVSYYQNINFIPTSTHLPLRIISSHRSTNKRIRCTFYYSYISLSKALLTKTLYASILKWILNSAKIFILIKRFWRTLPSISVNIIRTKYLAFYLFSLWLFLKATIFVFCWY